MKLEEAINFLNEVKDEYILKIESKNLSEAIETVLQTLENSIPKKKIEDKINRYQRTNEERGYLTTEESFAKKELQELLEE